MKIVNPYRLFRSLINERKTAYDRRRCAKLVARQLDPETLEKFIRIKANWDMTGVGGPNKDGS